MLSKERIGRITGSRIGAILGLQGAFKTRNAVLKEMVEEYFEESTPITNSDMQRGIYLEPKILQQLEKEMSITIKEVGFKKHKVYDFLGATPDGVFMDKELNLVCVEVKSPRDFKDLSQSYNAQIQLQMEVCDASYALFVQGVMQGDNLLLKQEVILRDESFIPRHIETLKAFMEEYQAALNNSTDLELEVLSKEYRLLHEEIKALEEKQKPIKEKLLQKGVFSNQYLSVSQKIRKGAIDYGKWCKDHAIEIPPTYHKPDTKHYEIRITQ